MAPPRKQQPEAQGTAWPGRQQPFIYFMYLCLFIYVMRSRCTAISSIPYLFIYMEKLCVGGGGFFLKHFCASFP